MVMMNRREYPASLVINGHSIHKVVIDSHYEGKHSDSITDEVILELVKKLSGQSFEPDDVDGKYQYFVTDHLVLKGKTYKLIWLLEDDEIYIGVVNCYRRK